MKTYEDFLLFLRSHLGGFRKHFAGEEPDAYHLLFAVARFLLSEPYRWQSLLTEWPHPVHADQRSDDEVRQFFQQHKGLPASFRKELQNDDLAALHRAYAVLFPMLTLKDEFSSAIFREEVRSRRYKAICREYPLRSQRVARKLKHLTQNHDFRRQMESFTKDLHGFSLTLIQNKNLLDQAVRETLAMN